MNIFFKTFIFFSSLVEKKIKNQLSNILINSLLLFFIAHSFSSLAQQLTTRKDNSIKSNNSTKILLIPFENKMYMSEIDYYINKETKMNQKQIRYAFRDGLNEQLYHAFKKRKFEVIDLMSDTIKYQNDLKKIYGNISYDFVTVPDQNNYQPPKKEKKEKGIQQGQVVAVTETDNKFMNTHVLSPVLIPYLHDKYKAQYYVFINELDLKASTVNPTEYIPENSKRKFIVHYTIFSVDAKEINSGIAEVEADIKDNDPNKIQKKYFSILAETIAERFVKQLQISTNTKENKSIKK